MQLSTYLRLSLVCAALGSSLAPAQQPNLGSIHGTVRLADTGGPAVAANVQLYSTLPLSMVPEEGEFVMRDNAYADVLHATVGSDGVFEIENVPSGDYNVGLYKSGYIHQDPRINLVLPFLRPPQKVSVLPGQTKNVQFELERGGSIEGRVSLADGLPAHIGLGDAEEVAVDVEIETPLGKFSRFGGAAHTDSNGDYSIGDLPTGRYIVFSGLGGRTVFAPNTTRASKAKVVEVQQPKVYGGVDIHLTIQGLNSVSGVVLDTSRNPIVDGIVQLYPKGDPDLPLSARPGIHGEFSFANLPDDAYTLRFQSYGATEVLGPTEDKTGIRMYRHKAPFVPASIDVNVYGHESTELVLKVKPAQ